VSWVLSGEDVCHMSPGGSYIRAHRWVNSIPPPFPLPLLLVTSHHKKATRSSSQSSFQAVVAFRAFFISFISTFFPFIFKALGTHDMDLFSFIFGNIAVEQLMAGVAEAEVEQPTSGQAPTDAQNTAYYMCVVA
jgi:hypothetical protein